MGLFQFLHSRKPESEPVKVSPHPTPTIIGTACSQRSISERIRTPRPVSREPWLEPSTVLSPFLTNGSENYGDASFSTCTFRKRRENADTLSEYVLF